MKPRRAPASITLVLIGSAALSGCGDETARRDIYRSSLDCQADWGDESRCVQVRSGPHLGYYYGPSYRDDRRNNAGDVSLPRQGSTAIGIAHLERNDTRFASAAGSASRASGTGGTERGGFGSSAASHAAASG